MIARPIQDILAERRVVILGSMHTDCATTRENLDARVWELDGELDEAKGRESLRDAIDATGGFR